MDIKDVLLNYLLPPSYAEKDETNGYVLTNLLRALHDAGSTDVDIIENIEQYTDADLCPLDVLPWLAAWFNFDLLYWSNLFGWSESQQRNIVKNIGYWLRYKSSKIGLVWFIENFISGAKIESIYEPCTDMFFADDSLSDNNKYSVDHDYYRECTVHIYCNNVDNRINTLLRWLLDPRVKYYVTIIKNYNDSTEWIASTPYIQKIAIKVYSDDENSAFISDNSLSDFNARVDGLGWMYFFQKTQSKNIVGDEWWPLMDSQWSLDDLSIAQEVQYNEFEADVDLSDNTDVVDGMKKIDYTSPTMGGKWWNIGNIEKIQVEGD